MNDVNEMWSSPWRKLQKNLASGIGSKSEGSGQNPWICQPQVAGRIALYGSWLVRARSLKARVPRIIQ
jgi:hypothetical protein